MTPYCSCFDCITDDVDWRLRRMPEDMANQILSLRPVFNQRNRDLLDAANERLTVENYTALLEICEGDGFGCIREALLFMRDSPEPMQIYLR